MATDSKKSLAKALTNAEFIHIGGKTTVYTCSYCLRDITNQFRAICAICPDVELCSDCMCVGVELPPHDKTHDYRVVDCLDFPVFTNDWSCELELLLLEGATFFILKGIDSISFVIVKC